VNELEGHRVQMRWRDIDGLGHINHAVALTYLEEGRDRTLAQHGIARDEYVVGRCSLTFAGEIGPDEGAVTVECEVLELGHSSLATSERIVRNDGNVAVEAEFGIVLWDSARRAARPLSERERSSLREAGAGER
jgi:acyl-CoA thioester hydrolase